VKDVVDNTTRTVNQVVQGVQRTTAPLTSRPQGSAPAGPQRSSSAVRPRGATPGSSTGYQPPLHGTNSHGQGTVAAVDLAPSGKRPLSGTPSGSGDAGQDREEVVVGRSRGEVGADGKKHGHITIAALLGNELLGVDTTEGQTGAGPLESVQTVLDQICTGTQICLTVLQADSSTTASSSQNRFAVATASIGGPGGITAGAAESNGSVTDSGNCRTSAGGSRIANATVGGASVATVGPTSTSSTSCRDGSGGQSSSSRVIGLFGQGLPVPAAGCGAGTADTETGIAFLAPIVCNAVDADGANEAVKQAASRYIVREALTVFALDVGNTALLRTAAAGAEARSEAPPGGDNGGDNGGDGGDDGDDGDDGRRRGDRRDGSRTGNRSAGGVRNAALSGDGAGDDGDGDGRGDGAACSDGVDNDGDGETDYPDDSGCSSPSDDSEGTGALAFTGANLLTLLLAGLMALAMGLRLRGAAITRRD
jgi:hypothetical protein